jgi:hypothetical protein
VKAGVTVLILCTAAACVAMTGRAAVGAPSAVARSYYAAYNTKDGRTMCRLFTAELNRWFTHMPGMRQNLPCSKIATAFIGYGEESDTPLFSHVKILAISQRIDDDSAQVTVKARFDYKHFPKPVHVVFSDRLHLAKRGGSWQVAKPGAVWFLTASAYQIPETVLDPPLTDEEAHSPAPQRPAAVECTGTAAGALTDPAGDAPASLDVRHAGATIESDNRICLRIKFGAPPLPGTALKLRTEKHTSNSNRFRVAEGSVRVGHDGRLFSSLKSFSGGWQNGELYVRFAAGGSGSYTLRLGGTTKTLQFWEPFVQNPLLGRGSDPYDGLGDSFGRPG